MANISSPENQTVAQKVARSPKCARCRNHGFIVQLKGHSGKCPFLECKCWKCSLITSRTNIMASQRRLKKCQKDESMSMTTDRGNLNVSRPAEVNGGADMVISLEDSQPQEEMPSTSRTESVIRMPARRIEADGKTYTELEVPMTSPWGARDLRRKSTTTGTGVDFGMENREDARHGSHWNGAQDHTFVMSRNPPHLTGEYVITEMVQKNMYTGEMVTMPFPFHLYSRFPNGYACPAILVNLPPHPPGAFKDPIGFAMPYPTEPGAAQEGFIPFFAPYPIPRPGFQEDHMLRQHPYVQPHRDREHGAGRPLSAPGCDTDQHVQGSQGSEVSPDNDSSSQDTV